MRTLRVDTIDSVTDPLFKHRSRQTIDNRGAQNDGSVALFWNQIHLRNRTILTVMITSDQALSLCDCNNDLSPGVTSQQ